jgi:hypothetical protein
MKTKYVYHEHGNCFATKYLMNDTICEVELLLTRIYYFTKVQNVGLIEALKLKTNYVFRQLTKS